MPPKAGRDLKKKCDTETGPGAVDKESPTEPSGNSGSKSGSNDSNSNSGSMTIC